MKLLSFFLTAKFTDKSSTCFANKLGFQSLKKTATLFTESSVTFIIRMNKGVKVFMQYDQITNSIISLVSINMVNFFEGSEFSPNVIFHYKPMFKVTDTSLSLAKIFSHMRSISQCLPIVERGGILWQY